MKKLYTYIIFCLIFVFVPFLNTSKAFAARPIPEVKLNTYTPVRVASGGVPTNNWKVVGTITNTEKTDTVDVWLTQTGKEAGFRINPSGDFKISRNSDGAPTGFTTSFTNLESGRYAVHSVINYITPAYSDKGAIVTARTNKTTETYYTDTNKLIYSSKVFDVVAGPVVRDGKITVKHLKNDEYEIRAIVDFYSTTKSPVIFLENNSDKKIVSSNTIYRKDSDKPTSQSLFAEFYNISGSYTTHIVYKDKDSAGNVVNINMANFSFTTTQAIKDGEISGDKEIKELGDVSYPEIGDVEVRISENKENIILTITGTDIPKDSTYDVAVWDASSNQSSPTYIRPSTGKLVPNNTDGLLKLEAIYSFSQIPKSGKYNVLTTIKKPSGVNLEEKHSDITIDKEGKEVKLENKDVYNVENTTIPESGVYKLLAPIPGIGTFFDYSKPNAFQDLINTLLKLVFGVITVGAVLITIYHGIVYMTSEKEFTKSDEKKKIVGAITAIILSLSSYLILNTINPDLVNLNINGDTANITVEGFQPMSAADYKNITGKPLPTKPEILALAEKLSKEQALDKCIILTVIAHESGGVPGFGPDENVSGTKSHRSFVASGTKYSGKSFTKGNTATNNDAKRDMSKPGWGLDWRFSKGIGFMQITFYPDNYGGDSSNFTAKWENRNKVPSRTFNWNNGTKETVTPQEMIDLNKNITLGTKLFKNGLQSDKCNGNIEKGFKAFHSGSCNSTDPFAVQQARLRMATYNKCKEGTTVI